MPSPLGPGGGVFSFDGGGERDARKVLRAVRVVDRFDAREVPREVALEFAREERRAVLVALAGTHGDLSSTRVDVLHAQLQALEQAQARTVEERANESIVVVQLGQDGVDFVTGEHDWQPLGRSGSNGVVETDELAAEYIFVEEEDRGGGLILCRRGHSTFHGEMGEELDDFGGAHLLGMAEVVVVDVPPDPAHVGLLGSQAPMAESERLADAVEQTRASGRRSVGHGARLWNRGRRPGEPKRETTG